MKILLTGKPGSGKSTVIAKFIESFSGESVWVKTEEIKDSNGKRVGFRAINSSGYTSIISHKLEIESPYIVGSNKVDLPKIDEMFTRTLSGASGEVMVVLDEIGPIQLFSENFVKELDRLFSSYSNLLATIHYDDEQSRKYRENTGVILVEINNSNRDFLPTVFVDIFENVDLLKKLSKTQQVNVMDALRAYINDNKQMEIRKLFRNALEYVIENRVTPIIADKFEVRGNHNNYFVTKKGNEYECECDFFLGNGNYTEAGECSHIQAVKLFE